MWIAIESAITTLLLSAPVAQSKPTEPPSREALAGLLAKSHDQRAKLPEIVGFKATLTVATMGRNNENITVTIASRFRKDVPRGDSRKPMDMIRYALDEGGKRLERGRDAYGYWLRSDGKVTALEAQEYRSDRDLVKQEISLARQLLSVVDPVAILAQLQEKVTIKEGRLPWASKDSKPGYWVATGNLAEDKNYPFYTVQQESSKNRQARLSLYVDKKTGMLGAVEALHRSTGRRELVLFRDYVRYSLPGSDSTGVLLPTKLRMYQALKGKYQQLVQIEIGGVALNPELRATDFERTR